MKPIDCLALLPAAFVLQAQIANWAAAATIDMPSPGPYAVISREANSAVWQQETYRQTSRGAIVTNIHRYVQLESGLNFWRDGQWNASREEISVSADGLSASGTNSQHQVYFPGDIYNGVVKLVTPEGQTLESQPIGVALSDGSNTVILAVVTNSTGAILPSGNQVIYQNAFEGLNADLIFTYTKSGLEQDVVLHTQPPGPAALGLNPERARLQMITEFVSSPQPNITETTVSTDAGNLEDDNLSFGSMQMAQGKAFRLGTNSLSADVYKHWLTLNGRQFLIEEVPIVSIAQDVDSLPPFTGQVNTGATFASSKNLMLPPKRLTKTLPNTIFATSAATPTQGLVLDYVILNSYTNSFVFQGDTTYYISGTVNLTGTSTNTFEGGAVIKYARGAVIWLLSPSIWRGSAYRPIIFTAVDDNSVGDAIANSTGNPTNYYASPALLFSQGGLTLQEVRIAYANIGIQTSYAPLVIRDSQFVNVSNAVKTTGNTLKLENVLMHNVAGTALYPFGTGADCIAQNLTVHNANTFFNQGPWSTLALTNSLLVACTNLGSGFTGAYNYTNDNDAGIFQTVGAGANYLATNCPDGIRSAGSTNIDTALLADLRTRTTHPPALILTNITTNGIWGPQVQRDTNAAPDLGYHYAPIDYAVSGVILNGTLTLANGVAVASFQSSYSVGILAAGFCAVGVAGVQLASVGTVLVHNQICHYAAVQEQPVAWGADAFKYSVPVVVSGSGFLGSSPAVLNGRFTDFNGLAGLGVDAVFEEVGVTGPKIGGGDPMEFNLRDCRVGPGWLACVTYQGADTNICINNLFDRGGILISDFDGDSPVTVQNNLFHNGYVTFDNQSQAYSWTVENNFFDNTTLSPGGGGLSQDHNGYWKTTQLMPTNSNDIVVTNFIYAAGPLGSYYQLSTNLLNQGSTTAAALGLYHHAVTTNEAVEGTNTVSIGFHYVVTDTNGIPLDGNQDGNPDYLQDANGNGIADNGEDNWAVAILSQPISQIVAPGTNVTFTATGAGLYGVTYQWQFTNMNISGATNATLSLTNVQLEQVGVYNVVVTGNGGMGSVVSSNAYLYLLTMPVITSQTLPTNPVCIYGNVLSFSVTATAAGQTNLFPFFYQWQCEGTNIPSATTNSYSFTVNDDSSGNYSVIVSNAAGSASASWQLTVTDAINVTNDLLLIYNTNSTDSTTVLNYYLAHRPMVSGANVLGISCTGLFVINGGSPDIAYITNTTVYETVTPTDFTNQVLAPVQAWLNNNPTKRPQYVILFLDVPSRVYDTATTGENYPFYDYGTALPSVSFQLATSIRGWSPFITHINMNGTNDCIGYINKLAYVGTNYSPGKLVISAGAAGYGGTNVILDNVRHGPGNAPDSDYSGDGAVISNAIPAISAASGTNCATIYLDGVETNYLALPHLTNEVNVAGYITWGAHSSLGGQYPTNAVIQWTGNSGWWTIETIESFNGQRYRIGQGTFVKWFSNNAFGATNYSNTPVGAVSHTDEPGLPGVNDRATYFGMWVMGKSFGICAWDSRRTEEFQAVGDPFVTR